jgi:hypothetical protein
MLTVNYMAETKTLIQIITKANRQLSIQKTAQRQAAIKRAGEEDNSIIVAHSKQDCGLCLECSTQQQSRAILD